MDDKTFKRTRKIFQKDEDERLINILTENPGLTWKEVSNLIKGRSPKQCRERWVNYLSPDLKKSEWLENEDRLLIQLINSIGNKWSEILNFFPNRSYSDVKNRYHSYIKTKFKRLKNSVEILQKNNKKIYIPNKFDVVFKDQQKEEKIEWISNFDLNQEFFQ